MSIIEHSAWAESKHNELGDWAYNNILEAMQRSINIEHTVFRSITIIHDDRSFYLELYIVALMDSYYSRGVAGGWAHHCSAWEPRGGGSETLVSQTISR